MRLPERFVITIEGTVAKVRSRHMITPTSLPHLLSEMLSGTDVPAAHFEAFGLRVSVEEDCDQGEEA